MRLPLLIAALLIGGAACAGPEADATARTLNVVGEGAVNASPDQAELTARVTHEDVDVAAAQQRADRAVGAYLAAARKLGAGDADLQASGASIQPRHEWDKPTRTQKLVGYRVTREVRVRIRALDRLGAYLKAAVESGMNGMNPAVLGVADETGLRDQALERAAADARRQAEVLAGALGATVGAARRIEVIESGSPMPRMRAMAVAESRDGGASPVATGEIRIERRVRVEFALSD